MRRPRVLIADDHRMMAESLKSVLEPEFEIVGIAADGHELIRMAARLRPDAAVVDISMPRLNGLDAAERMLSEGVNAKVVFLTMHADARLAARAFEIGASGYVLKHSAPDELAAAVREALAGRTHISSAVAGDVLELLRRGGDADASPLEKLTVRQREILQLLAEGRSAREIGDLIHISPRTVEGHKYRMMEALGIDNAAGLVAFAVRHGLASPDAPTQG